LRTTSLAPSRAGGRAPWPIPKKTAALRTLDEVELVEAKLDAPAQLRAAMDGVDVVFHAAAEYAYIFDDGPRPYFWRLA